tara:strand:+ start:37 stop:501 length:465 start_codon:yes stop_codon:yes gene_type:complete
MKKLTYLFLALIIFACGKTVDEREERQYLTREKRVQYYKGSPFSGTLVKKDERYITTREFKEGLLDGVEESYISAKNYEDENMNNEIYTPYKVSEKYDGYVLYSKRYYEDNEKIFSEEYHPNGQLESKNRLINGGPYSEQLELYDQNGQSLLDK